MLEMFSLMGAGTSISSPTPNRKPMIGSDAMFIGPIGANAGLTWVPELPFVHTEACRSKSRAPIYGRTTEDKT